MVPQILYKECKRCYKKYFTYDDEIEFCNTDCKHKYNYSFKLCKPEKLNFIEGNCKNCNAYFRRSGVSNVKFCSKKCCNKYTIKNKKQEPQEKNINKNVTPSYIINQRLERKATYPTPAWQHRFKSVGEK